MFIPSATRLQRRLAGVGATVERERVGRTSLQVKSDPRLGCVTTGRFAGVLAGIVRNKIRAAAAPAATKRIAHAKPVYQIVRTVDGAAAAAHVRSEVPQ
jgi:hypothetical protein